MAGFTDAMVIDGKAVIRKIRNGKSLRKGGAVNLEQCDIKNHINCAGRYHYIRDTGEESADHMQITGCAGGYISRQ